MPHFLEGLVFSAAAAASVAARMSAARFSAAAVIASTSAIMELISDFMVPPGDSLVMDLTGAFISSRMTWGMRVRVNEN